jgi:peptidoglycan/LPS O-acetylase OafA/YrhL
MNATAGENQPPRLQSLDMLRGVAILLVMLWHYDTGFSVAPAWSGVDLFFVLSGYLIGGILIDHRDSANYYPVFYVRRVCRILPLYLFVIALVLILSTVEAPLLCYLTFTQNFWYAHAGGSSQEFLSMTWSLAVEEQFYLVMPFIVRACAPHALPYVVGLMVLAAPMLRTAMVVCLPLSSAWPGAFCLPFTRMDALALGVAAAIVMRNERARELIERFQLALLALLGLVGVGATRLPAAWLQPDSPLMLSVGLSIVDLFYVALLLCMTSRHLPRPVRLAGRPLALVGIAAYSLYLLHALANGLFNAVVGYNHLEPSGIARFAILATANAVVAFLCWRLIERPFIDLGHRWRYRGERSRVGPQDFVPIPGVD